MKIYNMVFLFFLTLTSCYKDEVKKINDEIKKETKCLEIPNFIINKTLIGNEKMLIECCLDDNSIHSKASEIERGPNSGHIVPIIKNELSQKRLFVNEETLIGYDTLNIQNINDEILYSIKFPSPKGGTVQITRSYRVKDIPIKYRN